MVRRAVVAAREAGASSVMRSSVSNMILLPMLCAITTSGTLSAVSTPASTCRMASRMRSWIASRATPW